MEKITLYHGSLNEIIVPQYGYGEERHDYGKGFISRKVLNLPKNGLSADRIEQTDGCINTHWMRLN